MSFLDEVSGLLTGGQSDKANAATQAALSSAENLSGPSAQQLQVQLQQEVQAGTITPEQYQAILQDPNALASVASSINPAYTQATNTALSQLQNVASSNGMTPQFQNQLNQANQSTNANLQGQYGAIQQAAQQQGAGGSGVSTAAKLSAAQGAANGNNMAGEQAASNAQQNALNAIQASANLGQQAQGQAYNQGATTAAAQNSINQFNTQNKNNSAVYNTGAANQAQAMNLQNAQNIANANTGIANSQNAYNAQTPETVFGNQATAAGLVNNAANTEAKQANTSGSNSQSLLSGGLGALGSIGGSSGGAFDASAFASGLPWSDEKLKDNIKPFDAGEFLDHMTSKKWNYKPETGLSNNQHVGPMAQDLEKSSAGKQLVQDTPMGKKIDYANAGGHIFSALANIHQRVKGLEESSSSTGAKFDDKQDNKKFGKL